MSVIDTIDALKVENAALQRRIVELEQHIATAHNGKSHTRQDETLHLTQFSIDRAVDSIFWIRPDASFFYINDATCDTLGYTREELLTMSVADIDPIFPMEQWPDFWQQLKQAGALVMESQHQRKDDSTFPVELAVNFLQFNEQEYFCVFARDISERKHHETMLKRYAAIIEATSDGISISDNEHNVIMMNEACHRMLGLDKADTTKFNISQLHPIWAYERISQEGIPVALRDGVWHGETAVHNFQIGREVPISQVIVAHRLPDDSIDFLGTIMRDLTEQKEAERSMKQSHDMLNTILDSLGLLIYVSDMETYEMLYMNKFGRDAFGEINGRRCWQILQEGQTGPCAFCTNHRLLDEHGNPNPPYTWEFQNTTTNRWFSIADQAIPWVDGRLVRLEIAADVHDLKQTANELRIFKALIENAQDGIAITTLDAVVEFANQAFQEMSGFGETTVGSSVLDFFSDEVKPDIEQQIIPAIINKSMWQGVLEMVRPDGSRWPSHHSAFPVKDEKGQIIVLCNIVRDMTAQQRTEAERARLNQQIIDSQQAAIRELSTPLLPISTGVVALPLVGTVDSSRAQQVMETLLEGIAQYKADIAIVDITGVKVVDTQVAQALIQAARAVKLLGATVILTGIQPQIAQTLVHLGTDLGGIVTRSTLQSGVEWALVQSS